MEYIDYFFSTLTSWMMHVLLPAEMWEGLPFTMFLLDGRLYMVANECSGKMLFFYIVFVAFWRMAIYHHKGWWKLLIVSIPLSVLFNAIRCYSVMKWASTPLEHDMIGFVVYACVVIPCYFIPLSDFFVNRDKGGGKVSRRGK
jgi:exosortase/archaeosortase family protein